MAKYAEGTTVKIETTQAEIRRVLMKYGATGFMIGEAEQMAQIEFEMHARRIRFRLTYPDPQAREFRYVGTCTYRTRTEAQRKTAYDAEVRRLWRALLLTIKSKLEAVQNGMASFEEEMLPFIVLPNNRTVAQWLVPQIERAYTTGQMPPLLGPGSV
jgi:hypothetical protein